MDISVVWAFSGFCVVVGIIFAALARFPGIREAAGFAAAAMAVAAIGTVIDAMTGGEPRWLPCIATVLHWIALALGAQSVMFVRNAKVSLRVVLPILAIGTINMLVFVYALDNQMLRFANTNLVGMALIAYALVVYVRDWDQDVSPAIILFLGVLLSCYAGRGVVALFMGPMNSLEHEVFWDAYAGVFYGTQTVVVIIFTLGSALCMWRSVRRANIGDTPAHAGMA